MTALFSCSIDDGHPSDLRLATLLDRHDLDATFYFPITNCEGAPVLRPAQMVEIGRRFEIGSHTLEHRFLTTLAPQQAQWQIEQGKAALEAILGRPVAGFCYPGGKYRREHVAQVRAAGFTYARTTMNLCLDTGPGPFEMATTCQFYPHPRAVYLRNFARAGRWGKRSASLSRALQQHDWIERLYALFDHANRRAGVFHLWAHAIDVDTLDAWPALNQFLAYVAQSIPRAARLDNGALAAHALARTTH